MNAKPLVMIGGLRSVVGVAGFEPAASCSQGTRANQAALHPDESLYNPDIVPTQEGPPDCRTKCKYNGDSIVIKH